MTGTDLARLVQCYGILLAERNGNSDARCYHFAAGDCHNSASENILTVSEWPDRAATAPLGRCMLRAADHRTD